MVESGFLILRKCSHFWQFAVKWHWDLTFTLALLAFDEGDLLMKLWHEFGRRAAYWLHWWILLAQHALLCWWQILLGCPVPVCFGSLNALPARQVLLFIWHRISGPSSCLCLSKCCPTDLRLCWHFLYVHLRLISALWFLDLKTLNLSFTLSPGPTPLALGIDSVRKNSAAVGATVRIKNTR